MIRSFPRCSVPILSLAGVLILGACVSAPEPAGESETAPEGLTVLDAAALSMNDGPVGFERQVKPILESKCFACHRGDTAPAGFRMESRAFAMTRGESVQRIVPGKPEESRFLALAITHRHLGSMPPVGNRLTPGESKILRQWVIEGAKWPEGKAGQLHVSTLSFHPEKATD